MTLLRFGVILAIVLLDLSFAVPDVVRPFWPLGDLGLSTVTDVVSSVVANQPAARAGIRPGDSLVFPSAAERFRFYDPSSVSFPLPHPGDTVALAVIRGGQRREVTLVADRFTQTQAWLAPLRVVIEILWIALAALLVWQRPSVLTWSFFLFAPFKKVAPIALAPLIFPLPLVVAHHIAFELFGAFAQSAAIVFILALGRPPLPRWHTTAALILAPLFLLLNLPATISNLSWYLAAIPHSVFDFSNAPAYGVTSALWSVVALVLLVAIYAENRGKARQRIVWVLVGFAFYAVAHAAVGILPPSTPLGIFALLWTAYGILPLCVAYAILKHRLIDVSFFVSRGLAYAIISACLIAGFALINWIFSAQLSNRRLGTLAEIVLAIAFGLWFNQVQSRVDRSVERALFARKHRAEQHLRHLSWGASHAPSELVIQRNLVDEPTMALGLSSAALFEHRGDEFTRVLARNWGDETARRLRNDDLLALRSKSDRSAYVLDDLLSRDHAFPQGAARPDVVLPIFVRDELVALALYGGHEHGEHLDGDEIRALGGLAAGASTAYAQLEASRLQMQLELAQGEIHLATTEAETLRDENRRLRTSIGLQPT